MIRDYAGLFKRAATPLYLLGMTVLIFSILLNWAYDDPFITYRYAQNLARGAGFVYNVSERVLSTTTPLFALLLTPFAVMGIDLPTIANLFGALSLAAGGLLLWDLSRSWQSPWVGWAGLLLYPTFGLAFSTTGSETPLYLTLCLAAFAAFARQRNSLTALFCALATLARPDGVIVPAALAAHFALTKRPKLSTFKPSTLLPLAVFAITLLLWVAFAWAYFGSPIPVTLAAKQSQGMMTISQKFAGGLLYVLRGYNRWPYWLEAALAGLGVASIFLKKRTWAPLAAWPVLYFAAYTLLGVSRYFWYYAPLVPGFIVLVGLGLDVVADFRLRIPEWTHNLQFLTLNPILAAGILLAILFSAQFRDLWDMRDNIDRRYAIYRAGGEWLAQNIPAEASVGMLEVGIIGYYAQRPVVDFAGLIQPDVAQQMQGSTTYEDTALWAVEHYQPQYIVLSPGALPRFEQEYIVSHCQPIHTFSAGEYHAPGNVIIYNCQE